MIFFKKYYLEASYHIRIRSLYFPLYPMIILTANGKFLYNYSIDTYLPKPLADCKIAYIITAATKMDETGEVEKARLRDHIRRYKEKMDELHYHYTEIDIAGLSEQEVKTTLSNYDIVLVEWGNPFYLLQVVRETGFQKVMEELMKQWVVYIGKSAGSYIACPSLVVSTWSKLSFDRCGVSDLTATNRVPFFVKAHYTPEMYDILNIHVQTINAPLYALNNDQALVIHDGQVELIGGWEEVIITPPTPLK